VDLKKLDYIYFHDASILRYEKNDNDDGYKIRDYTNNITLDIKKELNNKGIDVILLGNGNKVIRQYPDNEVTLYRGDKIYLLTNNYDSMMIDFNDVSYKDAKNILNLMGVKYKLDGYGYVYEQNIEVGKKIDIEIVLKLKGKY